MRRCFSRPVICILIIGMLTLTSCQNTQMDTTISHTDVPPQPTHTIETIFPSPTASPSPTATITPSPTPPPPTHTPSHTPTPTWVYNEPGQVVAPILLYHHVNGEAPNSRYTVSIPDFRAQMQTLYDEGYTAITISQLVEALLSGGELPPKPIVITFDDGHQSVYDHAFPIMESFGFPGVFYIVAKRINNAQEFVNVEQLSTLIESGWEIGSHGYTHLDITKNHGAAQYEIGQSKADLQRALGVPINTFAYPFGEIDPFTAQVVSNATYQAGMGLGRSITHTWSNLYYLHRIEIQGGFTLEQFTALINPE